MPESCDHGEGFATGKLILCGEHAVVYGHPAIAFALERGTRVRLKRQPGPLHMPVEDTRLAESMAALLGPDGYRVEIESDLPIGKGMGSSAALAVATLRAKDAMQRTPSDPKGLFLEAMVAERIFHGNPSGLDVAAAIHGGLLGFSRASGPRPIGEHPTWRAVVMDSGTQGHTAELVAGVAQRRRQSTSVERALQRIGELVPQAEDVLHDTAALGALLTENHALLCTIGVSTPKLDELVELALNHGAAGAKLAGAGGGGVVVALTENPEPLLVACLQHSVEAFVTGVHPPTESA